MGLFKSAEERRIERDMEIRKGMSAIKRNIRSLEKNEKDYVKKAKKAKQLGSTSQLEFLKKTLKKTANQRRLMERQLLHIETLYQMKNQAEAHAQFAKSLGLISRSISDMFAAAKLTETQKNLEMAMAKAETLEQQMDMMLDMTESLMGEETLVGEDVISDDEIDKLLEEEIAHEESREIDTEIDQELSEIEKELGGA